MAGLGGVQSPPTAVYIDLDSWEPGQFTAGTGGVGGWHDSVAAHLRPGGHVNMQKWACRGGSGVTGGYYHANNVGGRNGDDVPKQGEHTESLRLWRQMKKGVESRGKMSWKIAHLEEHGNSGFKLGSCKAAGSGNGGRDLSRTMRSRRKRRRGLKPGQGGEMKQVNSPRICPIAPTPAASSTTTIMTTTTLTPAATTTSSPPGLVPGPGSVGSPRRGTNGHNNNKLGLHDLCLAPTPCIRPFPIAELLRNRLRLALYKVHMKQAKRSTPHLTAFSCSSEPQLYTSPMEGDGSDSGDEGERGDGSSENSRGHSPTIIYPITTRKIARKSMWECYLPQAISGREESPELGEYAFSFMPPPPSLSKEDRRQACGSG